MAIVNPTFEYVKGDPNLLQITWVLTTANTTGKGWEYVDFADITWHAGAGATWGAATAAVQGSNRDTDAEYGSVKSSASGNAITWTADGDASAVGQERPRFLRPKLTTPGTAASVTVTAMARRQR
jgi:hypothetical protein